MVRMAAPRGLGKHCHCCRQKRPTSQLIPCGASQGEGGAKHGPWCHRCILTKLHKSASFIDSASAAAKEGVWKCPRCDDVCPCNKCIQRRSKEGKQRKARPTSSSAEEDGAGHGEDHWHEQGHGCGSLGLRSPKTGFNFNDDDSDAYSSPGSSPVGLHGQSAGPGDFFDYRLPDDESRQRPSQGEDCKEEDTFPVLYSGCAGGVWRPKPARLAAHVPAPMAGHKRQLASDDEAWEPGCKGEDSKEGLMAGPGVRVPPRLRVEASLDRELSLARSASIKSAQSGQTDVGGACDGSSAWRVSTPGHRDSNKGLGRLLIQRIIHAVAEEEEGAAIGGAAEGADQKLAQPGMKNVPSFAQPGMKNVPSSRIGKGTGMEKAEVEGVERPSGVTSPVTSPVAEVTCHPGARAAPPPPLARLGKQGSLDDREWGPVAHDYGPRTPSLLDTVKCSMDSPGHSSSHTLAASLSLRKRLSRKGVPARGDSGLMDVKGFCSNESGGEGGSYGQECRPSREAHPLSRPRVYPCSPDVSFESLERARLQDEEEGVVDSVQVPRTEIITSIGGPPMPQAGRGARMLGGTRAPKASSPPPVYLGTLKASSASPKTSPQPPEVYSHSVSGDERDFCAAEGANRTAEFGSFKRPRSKRMPAMVAAKRPRVPRVASYFPDDVSLDPPSPSHSFGSSGSEGCSGAPLGHPWPRAVLGGVCTGPH